MAKMTAKYKAALEVAGITGSSPQAESLYNHLQAGGWFWSSDRQAWEYSDPAQAQPPAAFIAVRVWAASEDVAQAAQAIARSVAAAYGWRLAEMNGPYRCRPPKQAESRYYLKFLPRE